MSLKIIFMGTPEFAIPTLRLIKKSNHKILKVYTQSPKKKNRGLKINLSPVHKLSNEINLEVRHPANLNTKEEIDYISKLNPDVVVVVAYGKIIPTKMLNLKNIKFLNIHASLLPKWRGAAPIQRAIMNLDKVTGISIMKIEPKLDSGPVIMSEKIGISNQTNFVSLSKQMSDLGSKMILKCLDLIEKKKEHYITQDETKATYAKKISKKESKIDWSDKAKAIVAKVNALNPNPGSWFEMNGYRIKTIKAIEIEKKGDPGIIIDNSFIIGCSENAVQILELQKEGKKSMSAEEFLRGNALKIGSKLSSNE